MALVQKPFSDLITFTRASGGGRFNSSGVYEYVGNNVPRLDYDPVTLQPKGLLIEEQRTNLLTYSSDFANAVWGKSNASVVANALIGPDGVASASKLVESATSEIHWIVQTKPVAISAVHTFSAILKAGERPRARLAMTNTGVGGDVGTAIFDLLTGVVVNSLGVATINPLGGGFYLCTITGTPTGAGVNAYVQTVTAGGSFNYPGDGTSGIYIWGAQLEAGAFPTSYIPTPATFTSRASTATYFNSSGVLTTAAINEARYDHKLIDGQWVPTGLFLEAAATNLLTYSEHFDNAAWNAKDRITVTANADISPAGTLTADKLVEDTTATSTHRIGSVVSGLTSEGTYTVSFYVKAAGRTSVYIQDGGVSGTNSRTLFNMATLTVTKATNASHVSALIVKAQNDWFRVALTYKVPVGVTAITFLLGLASAGGGDYTGDGTSGIYIWGAQLEVGSQPTSYIPTVDSQVTRAADVSSSAQVTRSADVASVNTLSPWYNASEGTLVVNAYTQNTGLRVSATLSDGTIQNRIQISTSPIGTWAAVVVGNVVQADLGRGFGKKVAFAFSANDFRFCSGGGAVVADTSGALPPITQIRLGAYPSGSSNLNGHIQSLEYYPRRLSNELLSEITQQ